MADEKDKELEASNPRLPLRGGDERHLDEEDDEEDDAKPERGKTAAPGGIDLHPKPQGAVRVKKSIGLFVALGGFVLLMVIALAIATHKGVAPTGTAKARPTQSAAAVGPQMSAKMADQAKQAKQDAEGISGATGATASATGDVGDDLNVPPMKVVPRGGTGQGGAAGPNGVRTGQTGQPAGPRPLTPQQQAVEDEYKAQLLAMNAPMAAKQGGGSGSGGGLGSTGSGSVLSGLTDALAKTVAAGQSGAGGAGSGPGGGGFGGVGGQSDDQNLQGDKANFVAKAKTKREGVYLPETRVQPLTPYEVKAGWDIPATLEQAVNSDLPGEIRGLVRENVYDTATGHFLLIPQGSRVIGTYNHRVAYGQTGIQVVWTRLIYPDGTSINLEGMQGEDARGQSGFRDKVDNHYARLIGFAILTSAFSAGIELTQNQSQTGYPTTSQTVTQALGQQLGELGITITNRNLNIQPTIKIEVGYRFNIRVDRDIAFAEPYTPEGVY
jgi:type IV secretory pathway VirB10-like protein